jgi:hypothetical protein
MDPFNNNLDLHIRPFNNNLDLHIRPFNNNLDLHIRLARRSIGLTAIQSLHASFFIKPKTNEKCLLYPPNHVS